MLLTSVFVGVRQEFVGGVKEGVTTTQDAVVEDKDVVCSDEVITMDALQVVTYIENHNRTDKTN